jgi:arabinan endo-1,5-alpha-L-arabinosidase
LGYPRKSDTQCREAYRDRKSRYGPVGKLSGLFPQHLKQLTLDLQAPDVHLVNGQYYLYYAVSTFGSQNSAIGLATSPTMEAGSWTDHGAVGIASDSTKPYNAIDPNLILSGSTYYMNFGSFWHDIYQVQMDTSNPLTKGSNSAYNIAFNSTGTDAEEGSYIFFFDGFYYLLISSGICCGYETTLPAPGSEYRIIMCRSTSATGGFVSKPLSPIIELISDDL